MNFQHSFATLFLFATASIPLAAETPGLPDGIPPLTGHAVVQSNEGDDAKSRWTIALTLPRDTWREIQFAMPKLEWPEPKWVQVRPGFREGTMTMPGDSMPAFFAIVDMNGKQLRSDQALKQLETKKPVLVSASGRIPDACNLQLPTQAELIVLLGPGAEQDQVKAPATKKPDLAEAATKEDVSELKDWTEAKSQQYFFKLMQNAKTFKIETEEAASKYLQGIWRLDKRAHIGGGHYVRADRGADVAVMCTDQWLVVRFIDTKEVRDVVKRYDRIEIDKNSHLHVRGKNAISFDHFMPLDKDHMAVLAYDYIAVVRRTSLQGFGRYQRREESRHNCGAEQFQCLRNARVRQRRRRQNGRFRSQHREGGSR